MTSSLSTSFSVLRKLPDKRFLGNYKFAAAEGDEGNYEAALSNIAHAYIQDVAPDLLPYELGFQLVEKNRDANRALGVFGFKINNLVCYIPIFFIDGDIFGLDLLFVHNFKRWIPLEREFVKKLINSSKAAVGSPVDALSKSLLSELPNLMQFKPYTLKWAMDLPEWLRPFSVELVNNKRAPRVERKERLLDLLSKSASAARKFSEFLLEHPIYIKSFDKAYGLNRIKEAIKTAADTDKKPVIPSLEESGKPADVEIYTNIHSDAIHKLTETELATLRRQGYYVKDKRNKTTIIKPYEFNNKKAQTVDKAGFYHLLLADLSRVCAFVVPIVAEFDEDVYSSSNENERKRRDKHIKHSYLVVPIYRMAEDGEILKTYSGDLGFVAYSDSLVAINTPKDYDKHSINDFKSLRNIEGNKDYYSRYIVFTANNATPPIRQLKKLDKQHRGRTLFSVDLDCGCVSEGPIEPYPTHLVLDPVLTNEIKFHKRFDNNAKWNEKSIRLHVPVNAKYVKLINDYVDSDSEEAEINSIRHGLVSSNDILRTLLKSADGELKAFEISNDEVIINNRPLNKKAAFQHLILDYGLSEADAKEVLKKVAYKKEARYVYKKADDMNFPNAPPPPGGPALEKMQPYLGSFGQAPATSPLYSILVNQIPGLPLPDNPYSDLKGTIDFDKIVNQAIQSGEKEILDTSVFTGLIHATDERELIDKYFDDIVDGLNAIGQLLFNIYMHKDKVEEVYGKESYKEIENLVRNNFRNLGKMVVRLFNRPNTSNFKPLTSLEV